MGGEAPESVAKNVDAKIPAVGNFQPHEAISI